MTCQLSAFRLLCLSGNLGRSWSQRNSDPLISGTSPCLISCMDTGGLCPSLEATAWKKTLPKRQLSHDTERVVWRREGAALIQFEFNGTRSRSGSGGVEKKYSRLEKYIRQQKMCRINCRSSRMWRRSYFLRKTKRFRPSSSIRYP